MGYVESYEYIGSSQYFNLSITDGSEARLSDLNDNYTLMDKDELQELIDLLQNGLKRMS